MFRTIKPDNSYCLYFPNRCKGQRFVAGRGVRVWLWEEWEHIKLGQFEVKFPDQQGRDLFVTAEDLECDVRANFKIVIGGTEEGREERFDRATISCTPRRDINKKIEFDFFQKWATTYCKTSMEKTIKHSKYVNLFEDPDYRAGVKNQIEDDARNTLATIGLILVTSTIVFEPVEPKSTLATKEILDKWMEYRRTLDEAERTKQQAENEHRERLAEIEREYSQRMIEIEQKKKLEAKGIEAQTRIKILDMDARTEIGERQQIRDKEEKIRGIQEQIDAWAQTSQLQRIRRDAELVQERLRKEAEEAEERERESQVLAGLKQQYESQRLHDQMELLELEREALQKQMALMELKERISRSETELERIQGAAKAEVMEREVMARSADVIQMRNSLMEALPRILQEANRPIEKMGEIRILNVTGMTNKIGEGGFVGGLISAISVLPMVKEVIRFLGDWEKADRQIQSTTQEEKGKQMPKAESDNDHAESKAESEK